MKTKPLLIEAVPAEVKADFKAACAKRQTTMKAEILKFMEKFSHDARRTT